jgi:hypothetical protein
VWRPSSELQGSRQAALVPVPNEECIATHAQAHECVNAQPTSMPPTTAAGTIFTIGWRGSPSSSERRSPPTAWRMPPRSDPSRGLGQMRGQAVACSTFRTTPPPWRSSRARSLEPWPVPTSLRRRHQSATERNRWVTSVSKADAGRGCAMAFPCHMRDSHRLPSRPQTLSLRLSGFGLSDPSTGSYHRC